MDLDHVTGGGELEDELRVPRVLRDLADGRLTDAEADTVVAWLGASGLEEAPPWVVNRAVRIAGQALGGDAPRPAMWRRLVAALVYDNRLQPRLAGARAVSADHPRLMYEAGGVEIDLEVGDSSIAGRLRMLGQVTASEPDLARAWVIVDGPSGRLETEVDDLGQFSVDGLASGAHRMEIGLTYELIEIPEVRPRSAPGTPSGVPCPAWGARAVEAGARRAWPVPPWCQSRVVWWPRSQSGSIPAAPARGGSPRHAAQSEATSSSG